MSSVKPQLICNGDLEIIKITEDLFEQAAELFTNFFVKYENTCICLELGASQQTIDELQMMLNAVLRDKVSFAARDVRTGRLAAIACNIILSPVKNFGELFKTFRTRQMALLGEYLDRMESSFNVYKEWNIDCVLEIAFLSTHSDYNGRGLASLLSLHSIEYARKMLYGELTEDELNGLPTEVRNLKPKAVTAVFTSTFSQRVGEKCGFQKLNEIAYTEFEYNGQKFSEKVDPRHPSTIYEAIRLQ